MKQQPLQWSVFQLADNGSATRMNGRERQVLVVSRETANEVLPIVTVLPLAEHAAGRHVYPNEVLLAGESTDLDRSSIAMAHQITTVSKSRLSAVAGNVSDPEIRSAIRRAIRVQLDLDSLGNEPAVRGA